MKSQRFYTVFIISLILIIVGLWMLLNTTGAMQLIGMILLFLIVPIAAVAEITGDKS